MGNKINVKDLNVGDIFKYEGREEYAGKEQVAISRWNNEYVWVTNKELYIKTDDLDKRSYGYTSACVINIPQDTSVVVTGNMEKT